jgi:Tfp pilus assembly protein PilO
MNKLLKNQTNLFAIILVVVVAISAGWYSIIYGKYKDTNEKLSSQLKSQLSKSNKATDILSQLDNVKSRWVSSNDRFELLISKIPDISERKRINNVIFGIIKNSEIPVTVWNPSEFAIDEKIIFIPDTEEELKISKFPIDIEIICTFQDFGVLLEKFRSHEDRLAVSNLNIIEKGWTERQTVNFVLYSYFQTSMTLKAVNK